MAGGLEWGHGVTDGHQAPLSHPECAGGRNSAVCSLCKQSCVFMCTQKSQMSWIYVEAIPESLDGCTYSVVSETQHTGLNLPWWTLLSLAVLLLTFATSSLCWNSPHVEKGWHRANSSDGLSRQVVVTEQSCRIPFTLMLWMGGGVGEAHPPAFLLVLSLRSWTITKVWEWWDQQLHSKAWQCLPLGYWQIPSVEMSLCWHQEVKRWCPRLWKQPSAASQRSSCGWASPKVSPIPPAALMLLFFFFFFVR